ncbi:MAG: hypothetical protein Q9218_007214 [Villophora microphyllina]
MSGQSYVSGYDPKYGYNRNAFQKKTVATAILGKTVKLIATPLGLVSEAIHSRKDSKASTSTSTLPNGGNIEQPVVEVPADQADKLVESGLAVSADGAEPTHEIVPDDDSLERDEVDWALDDAAEDTEPLPEKKVGGEEETQESVETLTNSIPKNKSQYLDRKGATPVDRMPYPVVIPQRRPGTKSRGFVRAYAPVVEEHNIDQETFLAFLKNFHKAAQASPIFDIVIVAAAIAGVYPDPLIGLGILAVQVAAAMGQEMQERYRMNGFLDQANKEIFIPNKLYAMGDKLFDKETEEGISSEKNRIDELKEKAKQFRVASGESECEAAMPVMCAPLIFPTLDAAAVAAPRTQDQGEVPAGGLVANMKTKSKSAQKFVQDYMDRRGQATFAVNNPDAKLTSQVEAPKFTSRLADPNNATNMHFLSLITGGRWKAEPLGAKRRWEKKQRRLAAERAQGIREQSSKRILSENVVYLMVVNMPTEQGLDKAKKDLMEARERKAAGRQ